MHEFKTTVTSWGGGRLKLYTGFIVMENLEKSWNLKKVISRPGKVPEKNPKSFRKVMEMYYHMLFYAV